MRPYLRQGEFLFPATVLMYLALLIWLSFGLIAPARLFPLVILAPLTGLVVLQVVVTVSARVARALSGLISPAEIVASDDDEEAGWAPLSEVLKAGGWIIAFAVAMYLAGFYWAIALFTLGFARIYGRAGLPMAFLSAVGLTASLYLIFTRAVYVELHNGLLWDLLMR